MTKHDFEVVSNIPLWPRKRKVSAKGNYPWHRMKKGDSFFVEMPKGKTLSAPTARQKAYPGEKYATRAATEKGKRGFRVWRIK